MLGDDAFAVGCSASMFRDGQYLEVIKASNNCLATVVVTVQEKTVEIERRKVRTNKWLRVEDWAALYKILERAVLRNYRDGDESRRKNRRREWRKSTRQLEVTYTFEPPECTTEVTSLPTIRVHVSPAKKRSTKQETDNETSKRKKIETEVDYAPEMKEEKSLDTKSDKTLFENSTQIFSEKYLSRITAAVKQENPEKRKNRKYMFCDDLENERLEEYIPDTPKMKRLHPEFKYVPSRKSSLESMRLTNEYTPVCNGKSIVEDTTSYVPNSIEKLEATSRRNYEIYEPRATTTIPDGIMEEYIPNSKGIQSSIEEYEPGFKSEQSKLMKFDDSYVPSSVRPSGPNESKKFQEDKSNKLKTWKRKKDTRQNETLINKKIKTLF